MSIERSMCSFFETGASTVQQERGDHPILGAHLSPLRKLDCFSTLFHVPTTWNSKRTVSERIILEYINQTTGNCKILKKDSIV
jgi:hypothetical protein